MPEYLNSRLVHQIFSLTAIGKIEKHNHCEEERRNLITRAIKKKDLEAQCYSKLSLRHCLFSQNAISPPSYDKAVRREKQRAPPVNECSVFSARLLWLQLLGFVFWRAFLHVFWSHSHMQSRSWQVYTPNPQIKIAEFNCFHLLETDSLWNRK